jgi:hypothetical protein
MGEEKHTFVLNLNEIVNFIFNDDNEKNTDSEITELYVMDEDEKNMTLSTKQLREVKSNEMTSRQTMRYDLVRMFLDKIINIDDEITFGQSIILNTMITENLISEINEE